MPFLNEYVAQKYSTVKLASSFGFTCSPKIKRSLEINYRDIVACQFTNVLQGHFSWSFYIFYVLGIVNSHKINYISFNIIRLIK